MQRDWPILETTGVRAAAVLALMGIVVTLAACSSNGVHDDAVARGAMIGLASDEPSPSPEISTPEISTAVAIGPSVVGYASWYRRGPNLTRTCTGAALLDDRLLAASPVLPVGTQVRVTLLRENRSIVVRVNDCMPPGHRVIDLSEEAARELGLLQRGVALVRVTPIAWR